MGTRGDESETDSGGESGGDNGGDDSDTDWNMTVKGPPPPAYIGTGNSTDSIGYSEPYISNKVGNGDLARDSSPVKDVSSPVRDPGDRSSRSPSKDVRGRSPEKQIIPTGLSPAKSEQQIANSIEKKRESRSMEHLNTAVENRAKEEERRREESSKKENRKKREGRVGLEIVERRVRLNKLRIVKLRKTVAGGEIVKVMEVSPRQEVAGVWMKVSLGGRELNRPQSIHCFQSWQGNMELREGIQDILMSWRNLRMLSSWQKEVHQELPK